MIGPSYSGSAGVAGAGFEVEGSAGDGDGFCSLLEIPSTSSISSTSSSELTPTALVISVIRVSLLVGGVDKGLASQNILN